MEYYEAFSKKTFNVNKNTAILLTLLQLTTKTDVKFKFLLEEKTIEIWSEIVNSKKSLRDFEKIYKLDDEIGIDNAIFDNFVNTLSDELTKIFSDIATFQQDNKILSNFILAFGLKNSYINIKQVDECYTNIDKAIENLNSMNISEDGIFDEDEKKSLKTNLNAIQAELNNLMRLSLYDDTKTILLRDRIAETIRIQILDLHNNLLERETALNLLNISIEICGTSSLKLKLEEEKEIITKNVISDKHFKIIVEILKEIENDEYLWQKTIDNNKESIRLETSKIINNKDLSEIAQIELLDTIALGIKNTAVLLHNKKEKFKEAQSLILLAVEIAKSPQVFNVCQKDLIVISQTVKNRCGFWNSFLGGFVILIGRFLLQIIAYGIVVIIIGAFSGWFS